MGSSPSIHDVNAEYTERIAVVIQSSLLSSQSSFVVNLEDALRPHFARHGAQVYQLIAATDVVGPLVIDLVVAGYRERRDRTLQALARLGWQVPTPSMALYLWLPLPGWARERGWNDEQLAAALLEQTGLALTPGSGFGAGGQGWMRMALVRPVEELEAAVARLEPFWQQQC